MPHLLKEYSKSLEVNPKKPIVNKHFYPVTPDRYIVLYNEQNISSKNYRYYSLVIDLIKQQLKQENISVVIIGSGKDLTNRADYIHPNLSFRKNCYIVSKAELFISIDNALTQYASSQGVSVVNLYGNIYPSITTPYWSNKNNKIDISPEWDNKPCLGLHDPEDSINKIPAEEIAESILKILKPNKKLSVNFKTKVTNKIKDFAIDVIPTNYKNISIFKDSILNLRLDRGEVDDKAFYDYCSNHMCDITIEDKVLQPQIIESFSKNINCIHLILNNKIENIPKKYFELLKRLKIKLKILVKNKDILDDIRFDYFDQDVEFYDPPTKKPEGISLDDKFFSFKFVVEGDKMYKCTNFWKNKIDSDDNIVDNADYWEESDYFYIYEQDRH
jgi:hypothetical protein